MYLQGKGIRIPPFSPSPSLPHSIPKDNLVSVDRFFRVLPAREPLDPPTPEERIFIKPWTMNKYKNQVEALTFQCYASVSIWGVGLANPILPEKQCVVQWIRFYIGERGIGDFIEIPLLNAELQSSTSVVTDVYFSVPYQLPAFQFVTMKIKLALPPGSTEVLELYHGNHIGKCEDMVGSDTIGWEPMQTYGVEESETISGQQHFIGPILRLIYEQIGSA